VALVGRPAILPRIKIGDRRFAGERPLRWPSSSRRTRLIPARHAAPAGRFMPARHPFREGERVARPVPVRPARPLCLAFGAPCALERVGKPVLRSASRCFPGGKTVLTCPAGMSHPRRDTEAGRQASSFSRTVTRVSIACPRRRRGGGPRHSVTRPRQGMSWGRQERAGLLGTCGPTRHHRGRRRGPAAGGWCRT